MLYSTREPLNSDSSEEKKNVRANADRISIEIRESCLGQSFNNGSATM